MNHTVKSAIDARQTKQWSIYLGRIGWNIHTIDSMQIAIKNLPFFHASFIKIQHPKAPYPFEKIDDLAKRNHAIWTVIEPHVVGYQKDEFMRHGYIPSKIFHAHTATIKIDITNKEEAIFSSFSENARRNIRKAQMNNLKIKTVYMNEGKNWQYFDTFYSLLLNLGKMKKFYVPSYDEYYKKMTAFKDSSILLFAYLDGQPIAVVWYAYFDNVIAYFQTGITQKGYDTLATYLLVWEGMKLGKKLQLCVFDFESIYDERFPHNVPQYKNYTEFKNRFHGELIQYPRPWIKIHTFFGKILYLCFTSSQSN